MSIDNILTHYVQEPGISKMISAISKEMEIIELEKIREEHYKKYKNTLTDMILLHNYKNYYKRHTMSQERWLSYFILNTCKK